MKKDLSSPNWAFLSRFRVYHDGLLYLWRLRIFECPLFGIYLHKIYRPDRDRDLHDHPWPFMSFILRGAYIEEHFCPGTLCGPGRHTNRIFVKWFNWKKKATDAHRISSILGCGDPVWTLVLRGRRQRNWGFYTEDGWVPNEEYLNG